MAGQIAHHALSCMFAKLLTAAVSGALGACKKQCHTLQLLPSHNQTVLDPSEVLSTVSTENASTVSLLCAFA